MKIGLYGKLVKPQHRKSLVELVKALNHYKLSVWIHHYLKETFSLEVENEIPKLERVIESQDQPIDLDYIISLGGDGTFLEAVTSLKLNRVPIMGINTGRLGFLADTSPNEIHQSLEKLVSGDFHIEQRTMLEAETIPNQNIALPFALNELTVHKRETSSMITIRVYIDDSYLTTYWADGLIISTPTGSTAYSMSAGGPIVSPDAEVFIITPIASHNLTVRPLVIPDHHKLSIKVETRDKNFLLSLDSRSFRIEEPFEVQVHKAKSHAPIVKFNHQSFYDTIRNKLMWGIDKRN